MIVHLNMNLLLMLENKLNKNKKTIAKIRKHDIIISNYKKTITRTRQIIKYLSRESNNW